MAWRLAQGLTDAKHEVHVVAATDHFRFTALREGIPTYHLRSRYPERFRAYFSLRNPQVIPGLKRLYKQIRPDVINAHNIHSHLSYASLSLAHQMGIPAVFTSHDVMPFAYTKIDYFIDPHECGIPDPGAYRLPERHNLRTQRLRYNPFRNQIIQRILSQDTQVRTAPSQSLADAHAANNLPNFDVVYNGLNPDTFQASPEAAQALREKLGLQGKKIILFAGRLSRPKGTIQLMDAMQRIIEDVPEAVVLVLSSLPIEQQIQQPEYANLREKHIVSGGWMAGEELAAAYQMADVIVMPSIIFESFGMVLTEAMAAHKPVIASCYSGPTEIVVDGETGYLINPYDTDTFADRLRRLLQDAALNQRMGQAGYERLLEMFTLQLQVQGMLTAYERAIAQLK